MPDTKPVAPAVDPVNALQFIFRVLHLCQTFGGSITSFYRTEARNKLVGGSTDSKHLRAVAADVVLDNQAMTEPFVAYAQEIGLIAYAETTHIHLQALKG